MASRLSPRSWPNPSTGVGTYRRIHAAQSRMMPARLSRVRQLTFEEARWRTRELMATLRDRVRFRIRQPEWPDTLNGSIAADVSRRLQKGQSRCVINPRLGSGARDEIRSRFPDAV